MTILEAQSFQDVFEHLTPNTLLVVDLDNTLIECATAFGSFQWGAHLIKKSMREGMEFDQALDQMVPYWEKTQHIVEMQLVEKDSSSWLDLLIYQGHSTLGLTGRSMELADKTLDELKRNALKFSSLNFDFFDLKEVHYQGGIIFVGPKNDKGHVLSLGLQQINHSFDRVIFIDDQKKYIDQVQRAMQDLKLDFVGLHFTGLLEKVSNFDYAIALEEQAQIQF